MHGTFLCNWHLTARLHEEGKLLVYINEASGEPVAYQWGGLLESGILEVRDDLRGCGIGRALVEHRLFEAAEAGEDILRIQCKPSTSIPFWEHMGFELRPVDGEIQTADLTLTKILWLFAPSLHSRIRGSICTYSITKSNNFV